MNSSNLFAHESICHVQTTDLRTSCAKMQSSCKFRKLRFENIHNNQCLNQQARHFDSSNQLKGQHSTAQHSTAQHGTAHLLRALHPQLPLSFQLLLVEGGPFSFPLQPAVAGLKLGLHGPVLRCQSNDLLLLLKQLLLQLL